MPVLPRSDNVLAAAACSHCQRDVTEYCFTTDGGGLPIITYHCLEHGDVIPCVAFSRVTTPNR